jgi:hypothetical protein
MELNLETADEGVRQWPAQLQQKMLHEPVAQQLTTLLQSAPSAQWLVTPQRSQQMA